MTDSIKQDLITVGAITKVVDITRQGIYYYEELGLIKPAMLAGRIRLYTGDTIDKVRRIKELSGVYKLEAIKKMADEGKL